MVSLILVFARNEEAEVEGEDTTLFHWDLAKVNIYKFEQICSEEN